MRFKRLREILRYLRDTVLLRSFRWAQNHEALHDWPVISEFTTAIRQRPELGPENHNRIQNMKTACHRINGLIVSPGEIFSMERLIREPSPDNGFRSGPVLLRGKMRILSGGGLCQISTTLFNAATLANLRIIEKHNHSTDYWGDKRFIELGRDATYAYLLKDLKFQNRSKSPLQIELTVTDNEDALICRIRSTEIPARKIQFQTNILREIPPPAQPETKSIARPGYIVESKRFYGDKLNYYRREKYRPIIIEEEQHD